MIMQQIGSPVLRNNSLYKGGRCAVLFAELDTPALAKMPLFEV